MIKQKHYQIKIVLLALTICIAVAVPASAAGSSTSSTSGGENITQSVTQSYNTTPAVQVGMIVRLKPNEASTVEPLTEPTITSILGIVVPPEDAAVTLTPQTSTQQQVFVATAGRYNVLVSTQDGSIQVGDYITVSSLAGIGMKADQNQTLVFGKAAGDFNGTSNVISTVKLKNAKGVTVQVSLGQVPIDLDIAHNPLESKETDYVPSFLAQTATAVSNKPVSASRIYLGVLVVVTTTVLTGNLLYGGVRSGMEAIGRNPLSRKSIISSLTQTVIAGLIIFAVGIFAVYLLLKL